MQLYKISSPFVFSIFGASGDLAKVKIFPALYALAEQKRFPKQYCIYGFARSKKTTEEFRNDFEKSIRESGSTDEKILQELLSHVFYFTGQYDDANSFQAFTKEILSQTHQKKISSIHYLAVPPQTFSPIIELLASSRSTLGDDMKLVIEKPFGVDEKSAKDLFHQVSMHFDQENVFLLDHYLGKEAVQSILALRYANSILNTLLSGRLIANIQISALEDLGVQNRIHYFDQVGIIKDMLQSHLLQLLALLTMELPVDQEAENIHREKCSVLSALKVREGEKTLILGQHESYQKIPGVSPGSRTPTFAALGLFLDRQDWYQVPIYIRTGKMLNKKHTTVVVEFKKQPFQMNNTDIQMNRLILELYPHEKLHLKLFTKIGGSQQEFHDLTTSESLACFGDDCLPEHGRLLLNIFQNDHKNFLSFEEIIASWTFTDKLLSWLESKNIPTTSYPDFSRGPGTQDSIPEHDGFQWLEVPLS